MWQQAPLLAWLSPAGCTHLRRCLAMLTQQASWFPHAGDDNRPMLVQTLMGKVHMQQHVQRLISLRAAVKEQRTASMAGAASSAGAGAASASTRGGGGGGREHPPADPGAQLQACTAELLAALRDVPKPEEGGMQARCCPGCCSVAACRHTGVARPDLWGPSAVPRTVQHRPRLWPPTPLCFIPLSLPAGLQKLLEAKDNHIFRGLSTLAATGCTFAEAAAAAKDVLQRVGSKGPAADLARVLVARMTPNLLPPEALHAAMEEAEQSDDGAHPVGTASLLPSGALSQKLGGGLFALTTPLSLLVPAAVQPSASLWRLRARCRCCWPRWEGDCATLWRPAQLACWLTARQHLNPTPRTHALL